MGVGGRLRHADVNLDMLLSGQHYLLYLLLFEEHKILFHTGSQHMLSSIRKRFWITQGKVLAKRVNLSNTTYDGIVAKG